MKKNSSLEDIPDLGKHKNDDPKNDRIKGIYDSAIISPEDNIEKPEIVFGIDDPQNGEVWIGSKGNISLLQGAKKSRKTFATSAIASVVTGNSKSLNFKSFCPGPAKVLYVDTEQGKYDCKKVLRRMVYLSGLEIDQFNKNHIFLSLRSYNAETRKDVIKYALDKMGESISLLVIDGVRDLVMDINNTVECTEITTDLMAWSSNYNIHILTILHENKSDKKARGHIGTELENKCESILRVSKVENNTDYSSIEAADMRGVEFSPIIFDIQVTDDEDEIAYPELSDVEIEVKQIGKQKSKVKTPTDAAFLIDSIPQNVHIESIRECYMNEQGMFEDVSPLSAREFNKRVKKSLEKRSFKLSDHRARDLTDHYLKHKLLRDLNEEEESPIKKLVPGFDDDLPF